MWAEYMYTYGDHPESPLRIVRGSLMFLHYSLMPEIDFLNFPLVGMKDLERGPVLTRDPHSLLDHALAMAHEWPGRAFAKDRVHH